MLWVNPFFGFMKFYGWISTVILRSDTLCDPHDQIQTPQTTPSTQDYLERRTDLLQLETECPRLPRQLLREEPVPHRYGEENHRQRHRDGVQVCLSLVQEQKIPEQAREDRADDCGISG